MTPKRLIKKINEKFTGFPRSCLKPEDNTDVWVWDYLPPVVTATDRIIDVMVSSPFPPIGHPTEYPRIIVFTDEEPLSIQIGYRARRLNERQLQQLDDSGEEAVWLCVYNQPLAGIFVYVNQEYTKFAIFVDSVLFIVNSRVNKLHQEMLGETWKYDFDTGEGSWFHIQVFINSSGWIATGDITGYLQGHFPKEDTKEKAIDKINKIIEAKLLGSLMPE